LRVHAPENDFTWPIAHAARRTSQHAYFARTGTGQLIGGVVSPPDGLCSSQRRDRFTRPPPAGRTSVEMRNSAAARAVLTAVVLGLSSALRRRLLCAGAQHACAVMSAGELRCWGSGTPIQSAVFVPTGASPGSLLWNGPVATIACGTAHVCAVTATGVRCWVSALCTPGGGRGEAAPSCHPSPLARVGPQGHNFNGQLGIDSGADPAPFAPLVRQPVDLQPGTDEQVVWLCAGRDFTCALTTLGNIKCWVRSVLIRLVAGSRWSLPLSLSPPTPAPQGNNAIGQLGGVLPQSRMGHSNSTGHRVQDVPFVQVGFTNVADLTCGAEHACAVSSVGTVRCWGSNGQGQLGVGAAYPHVGKVQQPHAVSPVAIDGLTTRLAAGGDVTCAVVNATGVVRCCESIGGDRRGTGRRGGGGGGADLCLCRGSWAQRCPGRAARCQSVGAQQHGP